MNEAVFASIDREINEMIISAYALISLLAVHVDRFYSLILIRHYTA